MIRFTCSHCRESIEAEDADAGGQGDCPHCGKPMTVPQRPSSGPKVIVTARPSVWPGDGRRARIQKKGEMIGAGCLVQLLGLLIMGGGMVAGPVGLIFSVPIGLIVMIIGGRMAIRYNCGICGNRLADRDVSLCPSCHAETLPPAFNWPGMVLAVLVAAIVGGAIYLNVKVNEASRARTTAADSQ